MTAIIEKHTITKINPKSEPTSLSIYKLLAPELNVICTWNQEYRKARLSVIL